MRRFALVLAGIAGFLASPAQAQELRGQVVFENKPGCEALPTNITIIANGSTAEIHFGDKNRGKIAIDPASGMFLDKQTDKHLIIGGSIQKGALVGGRRTVEGGCVGRFVTTPA